MISQVDEVTMETREDIVEATTRRSAIRNEMRRHTAGVAARAAVAKLSVEALDRIFRGLIDLFPH